MASIAAPPDPTSSSTSLPEVTRPQAGPLPVKRGEIGFREDPHQQTFEHQSTTPSIPLPARHPADRDAPPSINESTSTLPASSASTNLSVIPKPQEKRFFGFLRSKKVPSLAGMRVTTLVAFTIQLLLLGGSIAGWALATRQVTRRTSSDGPANVPTSGIFIHVLFGVAVLCQLLFLERRIYRLRAERYTYLHPGQLLPSNRRFRSADPSIAFSPWNRAPLPTYAAALAQSGAGTGDVEDNLIAAPPPPAYGNTRGSQLLLSGYLRESLRAQRPASVHSMSSQVDRPVSYVSRDSQHEVRDAERMQRVQETLNRLEDTRV